MIWADLDNTQPTMEKDTLVCLLPGYQVSSAEIPYPLLSLSLIILFLDVQFVESQPASIQILYNVALTYQCQPVNRAALLHTDVKSIVPRASSYSKFTYL